MTVLKIFLWNSTFQIRDQFSNAYKRIFQASFDNFISFTVKPRDRFYLEYYFDEYSRIKIHACVLGAKFSGKALEERKKRSLTLFRAAGILLEPGQKRIALSPCAWNALNSRRMTILTYTLSPRETRFETKRNEGKEKKSRKGRKKEIEEGKGRKTAWRRKLVDCRARSRFAR